MQKILFSILFLICASLSFCQDERIESRYFKIYYNPDVDLLNVARRIDIGSSEHLLFDDISNRPYPYKSNSTEEILARMIDTLFLEVSDILDIRLYSFKGNIKISRDFEELDKGFKGFFEKDLKSPSFYHYPTNTIYLEAGNLNAGILGHEIAHAIICHYFVVLPPERIQEVLAGYSEYQVRKKIKYLK